MVMYWVGYPTPEEIMATLGDILTFAGRTGLMRDHSSDYVQATLIHVSTYP